MTESEYLSGSPITEKRVTYKVTIGIDNEIERSYSVVSYSDKSNVAFIETDSDEIEVPVVDIPLLVNALTDFIK